MSGKYYKIGRSGGQTEVMYGSDQELEMYLAWVNRDAREPGAYVYAREVDEGLGAIRCVADIGECLMAIGADY